MEARYNIHEVYQKNQDKKYEIFNKWCKDNGVLIPKLEYPSFFDGGFLKKSRDPLIQDKISFNL